MQAVDDVLDLIESATARRKDAAERAEALEKEIGELDATIKSRIARDATGEADYSEAAHKSDLQKRKAFQTELDRCRESVTALDTRLQELQVDKWAALRDREGETLRNLCDGVRSEYDAFLTANNEAVARFEKIRANAAQLRQANAQHGKFNGFLPHDLRVPVRANWPIDGESFEHYARNLRIIGETEFLNN